MNTLATLAACGAIGLAGIGPASAHAMLTHAQPAVGATVTAAPTSITLDFSEGVVPRFCGIALADAGGRPVATGKAANGAGKTTLVVPITGTLRPGTYAVTWHAVSVDTHRTQGSFRFTVAP